MNKVLISLLVLAVALQYVQSTEVFCYFTNWAIYRTDIGKFKTTDIDPFLCTVIIYAFVGVWGDTGKLRVLDEYSDITLGNLDGVISLKQNNSNLKVLLSMGGWNEGSTNYSIVAGNETLRANFVESVLEYIEEYNFDGFDLDWEYPTARNGSSSDFENFITLLREVNAALKATNSEYLLTVAVAGAGGQVDESYDVAAISDNVDFINLMTYDLRSSFLVNYTAHHAPLFASSLDVDNETRVLNVLEGVSHWLEKGADPSKLIVGIPFYGRSFTLANESNHGLYAAVTGPGPATIITQSEGFLSFQEICYYFSVPYATHVWDSEMQEPYSYQGDLWFGYDNVQSAWNKTQWALNEGLGGVMIYSLDYDDFNDSCGNGKYPLLNAINDAIADWEGDNTNSA